MLFYTGITRSANTILAEQNANVGVTRPQLDLLRDLAGFAVDREALHAAGVPRISSTLRFGTRIDREQTMEDKVTSVEKKLARNQKTT